MIVVDSSAVLDVLFGEVDADRMLDAMAGATRRIMSPVNHVEVVAVLLGRRGEAALTEYAAFASELAAEFHTVDENIAALAADAYRVYGKGRHPAGLNLGDCFAYATAKVLSAPLLYVGADFNKTDVTPVPV